MRRHSLALFASASLLAGCLGSFTQTPGGGSSPSSPSGSTPGGGSGGTPNNGASGGGDNGSGSPSGGGPSGGGSSNPDMAGPPSPTGSITLSLASSSETVRLNESKTLQLMVTPAGGFDGMVQFTLDNPPAGLTGTFNPPGMMMSGIAAQPVQLTLQVPSDFQPSNSVALSIKAASGTITASAPLTLDVPPELLVAIPANVDIGTSANPNLMAFGAQSIPTIFISPGTKVTFVNNDSINHEIHSDGTLGIQHEGGPLQANGANTYTQTFNGTGTFDFRCHIHPNMKGEIVVR
jgi:plastocyanin